MTDAPEFVFAPVHATILSQKGDDLVQSAITPACDFCLDTRVVWDYPCETFTLETPVGSFGSHDGWAACERCSERIEAGDFGGLAARSLRSWVIRHGPLKEEHIDAMGMIQQGFFDHRTGPRQSAWEIEEHRERRKS